MSSSVIILDCNACNWGSLCEQWPGDDLLKRLIASITVYANTHLSTSVNSKLIIVAAGSPLKNCVIFSSEATQKNDDVAELIDSSIRTALKVAANSEDSFVHTNYASAFAVGICYFSRFKQEFTNSIGRIVVINLSDASHGEQASLMNLFLSAQQLDLRFHVCSLAKTNPLLRQACDISGGVHRQVDQMDNVLQFLMRYCLGNSKQSQSLFVLRNHEKIDYQTSCFCHNQPVSLGFVCSVCLAVHCKRTLICSACRTVFKIPIKADKF